jgi:hypothetical protein
MRRGSIIATIIGLGLPVLCTGAVFGDTGRGYSPASVVLAAVKKSVIDKSCIMMCDDWGEHGCKKWVMRCKGDQGYPKGLMLSR